MSGPLALMEAPATWLRLPLFAVAQRIKQVGRGDAEPLSVYLDAGVVPRASRSDNHNRLGADLDAYLVVEPGDLVFNKLRTWQGGFGASLHHGIVSPAYFVCRPTSMIVPRYLHYLLRSKPYLAELTRLSKWQPPSQFDIPWDALRRLTVLVPPIGEQHRIVGWLDARTAEVDDLLRQKRALVSLLEERVASLIGARIAESVIARRGGSGEAVPLKRLMTKVTRASSRDGEMVTAFRDGQVTARSRRRLEGFTEAWTDGAGVQGVRVDDVVIHGLDGFAGAIGYSEADGVCSPVYHVCEAREGLDAAYLGRLLRQLAVCGYLQGFTVSTRERAYDFRNWDLFGAIPVPDVPASEQREIGDNIRAIAPLRSAVESSALLASEHRLALITSAVAGQDGPDDERGTS